MTLIDNKMKQFAKGNWGKPKGFEKVVKLRHLDIEPRQVPSGMVQTSNSRLWIRGQEVEISRNSGCKPGRKVRRKR